MPSNLRKSLLVDWNWRSHIHTCRRPSASTHLHAVGHDAGGRGLAEADAPLEVVARRVQQG